MLKLPNQLSDPKANEIVKTFVNERLINLMEEIILDEVARIVNGRLRRK